VESDIPDSVLCTLESFLIDDLTLRHREFVSSAVFSLQCC